VLLWECQQSSKGETMLDRFKFLTKETKIFIGFMVIVAAFAADWWVF